MYAEWKRKMAAKLPFWFQILTKKLVKLMHKFHAKVCLIFSMNLSFLILNPILGSLKNLSTLLSKFKGLVTMRPMVLKCWLELFSKEVSRCEIKRTKKLPFIIIKCRYLVYYLFTVSPNECYTPSQTLRSEWYKIVVEVGFMLHVIK